MKPVNRLAFILFSSLSLLLAGCTEEQAAPGAGMMQMPPPQVSVEAVTKQDIKEWKTYTGRLEAAQSIVVMPRTSGYVVEVGFEDGAHVKKGDLLFQVDYRTIKAEVKQLEAEVRKSAAEIELAERDLKRAESLRKKNAISQEQLDNSRTHLSKAKAALESAKANLLRSKVLEAITTVRAEFDGQVSNARVKVGSSVIAGSTVLTTLVSTDKVHAYFDVDEQTYSKLRVLAKGQSLETMNIPVFMNLFGEQGYPHEGVIDFVDNQVDISTGTIRLRAAFDNAEGLFTPGMFARLKMQVGETYEGIAIDEKAIGTDLSSRYVLVVGDNNIVGYQPVELGPRVEGLRVIRSGLNGGETIITKGLQRARPGAPVSPVSEDQVSAEEQSNQ